MAEFSPPIFHKIGFLLDFLQWKLSGNIYKSKKKIWHWISAFLCPSSTRMCLLSHHGGIPEVESKI